MRKNSLLTPFFAHSIRRMTETGIINIQKKRHMAAEPNCKPVREKGRPLGMEKFASLFAFYIVGCIISLIVLVMENIFQPKFCFQSHVLPTKSTDGATISTTIEAIVKELDAFTDEQAIKLYLLNKVKAIVL